MPSVESRGATSDATGAATRPRPRQRRDAGGEADDASDEESPAAGCDRGPLLADEVRAESAAGSIREHERQGHNGREERPPAVHERRRESGSREDGDTRRKRPVPGPGRAGERETQRGDGERPDEQRPLRTAVDVRILEHALQ